MKILIAILLFLFSVASYGQSRRHVPLATIVPVTVTTTLDPANTGTNMTLSNGNLTWVVGSGNIAYSRSTIFKAPSSGKLYCEVTVTSGDVSSASFGVSNSSLTNFNTNQDGSGNNYIIRGDGRLFHFGVTGVTLAATTAGHTLGILFDASTSPISIYYSLDGTVMNSGSPAFTGLTGNWYIYMGNEAPASTSTCTVNFGNTAFLNLPAGYTGFF